MISIGELLEALAARHGEPGPPPVVEPFEHLLWINAAYLVDDDRRAACLRGLRDRVGLEPEAILAAPREALIEAIAPGGMKPEMRADKVLRCAELAIEAGSGALTDRRVLRRFPGVSAEVADAIRCAAGEDAGLPLESNGLRVLLRVGYGEPSGRYERELRSVKAALPGGVEASAAWRARALLRTHGQVICRNKAPDCGGCPLLEGCARRETGAG